MPLRTEGRLLPPHPDPLPWGEGESLPDRELAKRFWFVHRWSARYPLPKGEGQPAHQRLGDGGGEGERDASNPSREMTPRFKARSFISGNSLPARPSQRFRIA